MFQFRRFPTHTYLIQYTLPCGGFPHSEISGSMLICSSPKLIAAYHVLHRLLMPRHSPCALLCLTSRSNLSELVQFLGSLEVWIMQAPSIGSVYPFQQNCNLPKLLVVLTTLWISLLLPSRHISITWYTTIIASFCVQFSRYKSQDLSILCGGPKWTRTIDLTIISRVL